VLLLGVTLMTQEYRYHTITSAFLITPVRWKVLRAKALAVVGTGAVLSAVTQTIWVTAGVLRHSRAALHLERSAELGRLYAVTAAGVCLLGLLGLALGTVVRNSTVALVIVCVGTVVEGAVPSFRYDGPFTSGLGVLAHRTAEGVPPDLVALCLWVALAFCAALVVIRTDVADA
jgi:hypothetical protein